MGKQVYLMSENKMNTNNIELSNNFQLAISSKKTQSCVILQCSKFLARFVKHVLHWGWSKSWSWEVGLEAHLGVGPQLCHLGVILFVMVIKNTLLCHQNYFKLSLSSILRTSIQYHCYYKHNSRYRLESKRLIYGRSGNESRVLSWLNMELVLSPA